MQDTGYQKKNNQINNNEAYLPVIILIPGYGFGCEPYIPYVPPEEIEKAVRNYLNKTSTLGGG